MNVRKDRVGDPPRDAHAAPAQTARYPRPGQPIAPRLLRSWLRVPLPRTHERVPARTLADLDAAKATSLRPRTRLRLGDAAVRALREALAARDPKLLARHLPPVPEGVRLWELELAPMTSWLARALGGRRLGDLTVRDLVDEYGASARAILDLLATLEIVPEDELKPPEPASCLEAELEELLLVIGSARKRAIAARWLGWDGRGGATFEAIGKELGVSGARVGQIVAPLQRLLAGRPRLPIFERAVAFVEENAPCDADALSERLCTAGISRSRFDVRGLLLSSRQMRVAPPFAIVPLGGRFLVRAHANQEHERAVIAAAALLVKRAGAAHAREVAKLARKGARPLEETRVLEILELLRPDFEKLEADGWFWLRDESSPIVRTVHRMLCFRKRVSLAAALEGVRRTLDRREFVSLLEPIFRQLCRRLPGVHVENDEIEAVAAFDRSQAFVGAEQEQRVAKIVFQLGGVAPSARILEEARRLGIPAPSVHYFLGRSGVFVTLARGLYGLVGAETSIPLARIVKALGRKRVLGCDLTAAELRRGVFQLPSSGTVHGRSYRLVRDGVRVGTLFVRQGYAWGLESLAGPKTPTHTNLELVLESGTRAASIASVNPAVAARPGGAPKRGQ